jgi:hypothetical protein
MAALLVASAPAHAQATVGDDALENFVQRVVRLWSSSDVTAIVNLLPSDNRLVLDTGSGIENANSRHAAAALRALFSESETVGARAVRITVASTLPAQGFGELDWRYRARGSSGEQSRSVYVAAAWEDDGWRITELRLMP